MGRVTVRRSAQLTAKLKALREQTMPAIRPAMEEAAQIIVNTMKNFVPVDDGDLKESIGWTWGDAPSGSISMSHSVGDTRITIYAGNEKAFYARWVEFGTAPHALGKGSDVSRGAKKQHGTMHPGSPPRPFFFPAYRAHMKTTKRKISKAVRDEVRKISAK